MEIMGTRGSITERDRDFIERTGKTASARRERFMGRRRLNNFIGGAVPHRPA